MKSANETDSKVIQVTVDAVTRDNLRAMAIGQALEFIVPGKGQMESARSACNQLKLEQMKFTTKFNVGDSSFSVYIKRLQ